MEGAIVCNERIIKRIFTVEAAVLYPIVLGVIVLMTYLLFFQYDRCLLEQDMGRAAVRSGSRWMQKKEELNRQLQEKDMFFDYGEIYCLGE